MAGAVAKSAVRARVFYTTVPRAIPEITFAHSSIQEQSDIMNLWGNSKSRLQIGRNTPKGCPRTAVESDSQTRVSDKYSRDIYQLFQ